jgi:two-component system NtrC family sensor kinase
MGLEDNRFIDEEIDRLDGIVSQALQAARQTEPVLQTVRLVEALRPFCELLEPSLRNAGIRLRTDFRCDPEIHADANQLKQALLNLVNNAAESIGHDGTITLRTRLVTWRGKEGRLPGVALEVEDTGKGIPAEVRGRLFDPFFTTKENGTGLGLSITERIAFAHGGMVELESEPGRGALFRVLLPINAQHEKTTHSAHRR